MTRARVTVEDQAIDVWIIEIQIRAKALSQADYFISQLVLQTVYLKHLPLARLRVDVPPNDRAQPAFGYWVLGLWEHDAHPELNATAAAPNPDYGIKLVQDSSRLDGVGQ